MQFPRFSAAEFPNDNPRLHRGSMWICREPCAAAAAELARTPIPPDAISCDPPPVERAPDGERADDHDHERELDRDREHDSVPIADTGGGPDTDLDIEIVEHLEDWTAPPPPAAPPAPAADPFATLAAILVDVATAAGAPHGASLIPSLLGLDRIDTDAIPQATRDALLAARIVTAGDAGLARGESFVKTARAFTDLVRGAGEDWNAIGASMLDEWCADLVAAVLASPGRSAEIRRELRSRGVAAFGIVIAA